MQDYIHLENDTNGIDASSASMHHFLFYFIIIFV